MQFVSLQRISPGNKARMGRADVKAGTNCGLCRSHDRRPSTNCATSEPIVPEMPPRTMTCHMLSASVTASTTAAKQAQNKPVINEVSSTIRMI